MTDLKGKRVLVVGLGKSGAAAARLCSERGATLLVTDTRAESEWSEEALALPAKRFAGGHEGVPFADVDLIVVSPGVPAFPALAGAEARGIPVIGELELATRMVDAPVVAIGGTNGKSTVTTATARLLEAAGKKTFSGGNLGTPVSEAVGEHYDVLVVEVSSFQLERAPTFRPQISVLLNVTEDHLDRYPSFDEYANAKGNAFANQTRQDLAIIPAGDAVCRKQAERGRARIVTFGSRADYQVHGAEIIERRTGNLFSLLGTDFHGTHNYANAAAAIAVARAFDATPEDAAEGLAGFRALPHRMALVRELDRVRYYDDSKATNVGAAVTAVLGLTEKRAVLIAGGRDKLGSYAPLASALSEKGRAVVLIGEAADEIAASMSGTKVPVVRATSLEDAVAKARTLAKPGDAVLLSPACSSFDMFQSYADRGDRFANAVRELATGSVT